MAKIMVVEDEEVTAGYLQEALTRMGYEVAGIAGSGKEAVAMASEIKPDLILMDIVLPGGLDGIDVTARIKKELDIPVVFITGYPEDEFVNRAKRLQPYGYILKPVQMGQLRATVEIALYKKEMDDRLREALVSAHEEMKQRVEERTRESLVANEDLKKEIWRRKQVEMTLRARERQYRDLIDSSDDYIYQVDPGGTYLLTNKKHRDRFRLSSDRLTKKTYGDLHTDREAEAFRQEIEEVVQSGRSVTYEYQRERDGRHFLRTMSPVKSPKGKTEAITVISKDITARKETEIELERQRREQQIILDSIPAMVFFKDRDNRLLRVNQAFARETGLSRQEIEGKSAFDLAFASEQARAYWEDDKEVINSGNPKRNIVEPLLTDNNRWFKTDKVPYRDEHGDVKGVIGFSFEVTQLKEAEEALRDMHERLKEENHQRRMLSARLIELLEKDRHDIAMDLHDHIGQSLTSLNYSFEMCRSASTRKKSLPSIELPRRH
jgi:PAS domain S-box-containing protein